MEYQERANLRWTGHPFVDMGVATLVAYASCERPEDVTLGDLERFAREAERLVFAPAVSSHASVLFTSNGIYLQPGFPMERKRKNAQAVFRSYRLSAPEGAPPCVYCGQPALALNAVLDTKHARGNREIIPMVTGQGVANFYAYGAAGINVCGLCLTAIQALPIGAPSCEGRALLVTADDPQQLVAVVKDWLPELLKRGQLSEAAGEKVEGWRAPRTRLVERLVDLQRDEQRAAAPSAFTIYHVSNSGQGPDARIHFLSAAGVGFVRNAQGAAFQRPWRRVTRDQWIDAKKKRANRDPSRDERTLWRNSFYEALYQLPEGAWRFVKRYFLAPQTASLKRAQQGPPVALWELTALFLSEVLGMNRERILAIRELADALATEIDGNSDAPLFRQVYQARKWSAVRRIIIRTNRTLIQRGHPPVLDFDGFLSVFQMADDVDLPYGNWDLAWDLVLIRLIDRLHEGDFFQKHREATADLETADEATEDEQLEGGAA